MKNFLEALIVAVAVGFVVFVLATVIGTLPHLKMVGTYAEIIGLIAGLLVFVRKWDFNF